MRYTPTSEQEVVVLFGLLLPQLPIHLELDEVGRQFPDCLAWRIADDGSASLIRIEFELYTSNFRLHRNDPAGCDPIVCWEDDVPGFPVPRLALRPIVEGATAPIISVPMRPKYAARVWGQETYLAACDEEVRPVHGDLLGWATGLGEVVFGKGGQDRVVDVPGYDPADGTLHPLRRAREQQALAHLVEPSGTSRNAVQKRAPTRAKLEGGHRLRQGLV